MVYNSKVVSLEEPFYKKGLRIDFMQRLPPKQEYGSFTKIIRGFLEVKLDISQSLFSNAIFIALAGVIPALSGYLYWAIAARFATPHEIGIASSLLSITAFINLIFGLDMGTILIRDLPRLQDATKLINASLFLRFCLAALGASVFLLTLPFWKNQLGFLTGNVLLALGFIVSNGLYSVNELLSHIFVAYRNAFFATLRNAYVAAIRFIPVGIGVVLSAKLKGIDLYAAVIFSMGVVFIITFTRHFRYANIPYRMYLIFSFEDILKLVQSSLLNFVGVIALQSPILLLPLMVMSLLGSETSGVSYIVIMVATMAMLISEAIARSMFSEGIHSPQHIRPNLAKSLVSSTAVSLLMLLSSVLVGDFVLRQSFGSIYADQGTTFLILLMLSVLPISVIQNNLTIMRLRNRMGGVAAIGLVVGLVSLVAMYFLMQSYNLVGGGLGFFIGNLIGAILSIPQLITVFTASSTKLRKM